MATRFENIPGSWWAKCALAGIVGGILMALYEMTAAYAMGMGFWAPINMMAATLPAYRPPAEGFQVGPFLTGATLHMVTSATWGLIFGALVAYLVPQALRNYGVATLAGVVYGLGVYLIMGLGIGPILDPALRMAPPLHYFIGHIVYGLGTALALKAWTSRRELAVTFAPEVSVAERETTIRR